MRLIAKTGVIFFLIGIFITPGWTTPEDVIDDHCFVVLKSPPVWQMQKNLSGNRTIRTSAFQAKQSEADSYAKQLRVQQNELTARIQSIDPQATVLRKYTQLVNAMHVNISSSRWADLRALPNVAYIAPVRKVKLCLTNSGDLLSISQAWETLGGETSAGEGVSIAVIDTGIDITHPSFDDTGYTAPAGFPKGDLEHTNNKVIVARVFPYGSGEIEDTTAYDNEGHGTHVASIAASNVVDSPLGTLSGMAPKAYLGNYKVFTSEYADNSQVIDAVEQAIEDGMDIINLSLGSEVFADPQHDLQVMALQNAVDLGVTVVVASGNGDEALTIGNPAQTKDAIAVGSTTNSHQANGAIREDELSVTIYVDGEIVESDILAVFSNNAGPLEESVLGAFSINDVDLIDGGEYGGLENGLLCEQIETAAPIDSWLLVQRGDCLFSDKVERAEYIGAKGVLFYDSQEASYDRPDLVSQTGIPSMMIARAPGLLIKEALLNEADVRIKVQGASVSDSANTPHQLSYFNSIGPSAGYIVKPDLVSIGEDTFGATQNDNTNLNGFIAGGFNWMSGTSFSSPHVAGVVALLIQKHPDWPPLWIKSALMLSAVRPVPARTNGFSAPLLERGAGRVDADAALDVDTIAVPSIIEFGARSLTEQDAQVEKWITVINVTEQTCSFTLVSSETGLGALLTLSEEVFILEPGEKTELTVTASLNENLTEGDHETDLILTNETTGQAYLIPCWIRLKTVPPPNGDVLLVDDDDGNNYETYYQTVLENTSQEYTYWDVDANGEFPTRDYMEHFKTVFWFLSEKSFNHITDESSREYALTFNTSHLYEMDLMQYLVDGGSLFLSGQDYTDDRETSAFMQEILRVERAEWDPGSRTVQESSDSVFGAGLGPFTLTFPGNYDNYTDDLRSLDTDVTKPLFYSDGDSSRISGVTVQDGAYRAIFLAFPLETLDETAGTAIVTAGLDWLQNATHTGSSLTRVTPQTINLAEDTPPYGITIEGQGFSVRTGIRAYLDFITLENTAWETNETLSAEAPSNIEPGTYTLRVTTGDGQDLRLLNALQVINESNTRVIGWQLY